MDNGIVGLASTSYNDLVGTIAADTGGHRALLEALAKENGVDIKVHPPVGIRFYFPSGGERDVWFHLFCADSFENYARYNGGEIENINVISFDGEMKEDEFHNLFEEMVIELHVEAQSAENINVTDTVYLNEDEEE